MLEISKTDY